MRSGLATLDRTTRTPAGSESVTSSSRSSAPKLSRSAETDAARRARASGWSGWKRRIVTCGVGAWDAGAKLATDTLSNAGVVV